MIRVVAFDLDDTLWHVDPVIRQAEVVLAGWLESEIPGYSYEPSRLAGLRKGLVAADPTLAHRLTAFRQKLIEASLLQHGVSQREAEDLARHAMEVFLVARNKVTFFDGALDTLRSLTEQYSLGALTNGNANIRRLGLEDIFSFAFSAEEVGAPKPAPNLFHAALEHTGCDPVEMVYVGDDPVKDVDAANRVGLRTIWMKSGNRPVQGESVPDVTIEDIRDLPHAVMALTERR